MKLHVTSVENGKNLFALDSIARTECTKAFGTDAQRVNTHSTGRCAINGAVTVKSCRNKLHGNAIRFALCTIKKRSGLQPAREREFIYLPVGRHTLIFALLPVHVCHICEARADAWKWIYYVRCLWRAPWNATLAAATSNLCARLYNYAACWIKRLCTRSVTQAVLGIYFPPHAPHSLHLLIFAVFETAYANNYY